MIETTTLDNGLRVVCQHRPGQVAYCGLAVNAGTRHQLETESGMAHFIEHMSFKGTQRRRAWHIINNIESVGGELNAFTSKEHTVYYCSLLRQHLKRGLDLLFDICLHSTFPQHELEREVEVVCDEIESYNDAPSELIYDDFEALIFCGHPLGRNILGEADRLRQYESHHLQTFAGRLYHPNRMVLFVLGDVKLRDVERLLQHIDFGGSAPSENVAVIPPAEVELGGQQIEMQKQTHQAHVVLGAQAFSLSDERYMPLYLLNNILGGPGMNARLNMVLRERNGLVYTVESSVTGYTDTGLWTTYFGCDHADVGRCLRLVHRELNRLADAPLSESTLRAAKRQLKGQLALAWENGENVAIGMGRRLLHLGRTQSLDNLCMTVDALTAQQLRDTAAEVFAPNRLVTLRYV